MLQRAPAPSSGSTFLKVLLVFTFLAVAVLVGIVPRLTHPSKLDGRQSILLSVSWWDPALRPASEAIKIWVTVDGAAQPVVMQRQSPWNLIIQVPTAVEIVLYVVQKLAAEASRVPQSSTSCAISRVGGLPGGLARNQRGPAAGILTCEYFG